VNLGAGTGSFLNSAGAAFVSGGTVNLGGGEFNNAGWLSPGDTGRVLTTQLAGSFTQQDSGTFAVDLDIQQTAVAADRIEVSGNAQFSGNVVLNVLNTGYAMPGDHVATILSAGGNVTHADSALQAPQSAVATYELRYPDAHRIEIAYGIDFAARGALNRNQTSIGEAINALQSAGGSSSFSSLATDLIGLTDAAALASAYDSLSPEIYVGNETGAIFSSLSFSDSMMSCRAAGGQFQFAREEECRWIRLGQDDLRQDGTEENFEFNRTSYNLAGGAQWETGDSWHLGFALGLSLDNLDVGDLSSSEGKQYQAGLSAKWRHENTTLSATLSGGYADYETLRTNDLPGAGGIVTSNPRMNLAASHLRLGHVLDYGSWYLRPLVDAGVSYVDTAAFSEQGSSGGTLEVKSGSGTVWTVQPEIELGAEHAFASGSTLRSYLRFGLLHWLSGTTPDVEAAFRGAPDDVDPFIVSGSTDRNFGSVTLGLSLMREKNFELRLDYSGRFSDNTSYQGAGLKFASRF
jgi:uncharacterized protein with beta-barrel porin domain